MVAQSVPYGRIAASVVLALLFAVPFPVLHAADATTSTTSSSTTTGPPPPPAPSSRFGVPGVPTWDQYTSTGNQLAGEPTIGISWKGAEKDHPRVLMEFNAETNRVDFGSYVMGSPLNPTGQFPVDAASNELAPVPGVWVNTANLYSIQNVDPFMITDPDTGRTLAGGLDGENSIFGVTDDVGATWSKTPSMPASGAGWDHESAGSGTIWSTAVAVPPSAGTPLWAGGPFYYCSQSPPGVMACSRSDDGGITWQPTRLQGGEGGKSPGASPGCGGLHGHPRVSTVDGFVYVPSRNCGGRDGFVFSTDNGDTWDVRTIAAANGGFDPALGISRANVASGSTGNWLYYAQGDNSGAHVALSKATSRTDFGTIVLGTTSTGGTPSAWYDLGALTSPPILKAVFPSVVVGDDERASVSFLGSTDNFNHDACKPAQIWDYYVASTFDGGASWTVKKANPSGDPVQKGGVWSGGTGSSCRTLLDFNDMKMDAHGRLYIGFGDACIIATCPANNGESNAVGSILRQRTGCGLFKAFDAPGVDCKGGTITIPPLGADAHGPYAPSVGVPIAILGDATGGVPAYTCAWTGSGVTFSSTTSCTPTVKSDDCDPHTITLTLADSQTPVAFTSGDSAIVTATDCPTAQAGPSAPQGGGETPYPQDQNAGKGDLDGDGVIDHFDNCPRVANANQADIDGDGLGDACDDDMDGDGYTNANDDCPAAADRAQRDTNADGQGDACVDDIDGDGVKDALDNCPTLPNTAQSDLDTDKLGNVCDNDRDGDGVDNNFDAFPDDPLNWTDSDQDLAGDQTAPALASTPAPSAPTSVAAPIVSKVSAKAPGVEFVLGTAALLCAVVLARRRK